MALVVKDRVKETTTTTGTGTYTLGGAVTGFETFTSNLSNADTTYYVCTDGTDFEVGIGTFTSSGTTLARTTILASSNSNNEVNWTSGTREIFITYPADKSVFKDASNNINGTFVGNITGNVTGNADTATVATTVTITDNENTNEDNAIIFTAGGDVDGGNLGLESDGDLIYNPSTGRLTATQLAGTLQTAAQTNITSVGTLSSLTTSGDITVGDDLTVEGGQIDLRSNSGAVGKMKFYCEVSNAHAQTLQAQPHSASSSAVLTLPVNTGTLVGTGDTGSVSNTMLAGSIANDKLAGSIANAKLANSSITVSDGSSSTAVALGGTVTFAGTSNEVEVGESSGTITVGLPNDVTIAGNLTVNGTTTTIDTTNTLVKDSLLGLNNGASSNSNDSGIIIERGSTGNDALFIWDESEDKFALGTTTDNASSTGNLNMTTGTLVANIEGNVTGNVTGNVSGSSGSTTGNAATATALATGRTIAMTGDVAWTSASFDGSGNVTGTATIQSSAVETSMINADAVTGAKIADDAIDSEHYTDGSIDTAHIADDQVTQAKIADDAVGADQLASNAVVNASVASGAAIDATKIHDGTISNTEFGYLNNVSSNIQTQLDAKASAGFALAMAICL